MRSSFLRLTMAVVATTTACGPEVPTNPETEVMIAVQAEGDGSGSVVVETPDLPVFPWECTIVDGNTTGDGLNTGRCSRSYTLRDGDITDVEFTAAGSGSRFVEWGAGPCSGTNTACRVPDVGSDYAILTVTARFEATPASVALTVDGHAEALFLLQGLEAEAAAVALKSNGQELTGVTYAWTSSDPSVASVSGTSTGAAIVRAEAPGSATITATARGVASNPVLVTVPSITNQTPYSRSEFVTVADPIWLDFDAAGSLFVGNTGGPGGGNLPALVRKVTPDAVVSAFGDPVADPDALLVDEAGLIATLGPGSVLVTGAYDSQYSNNHVTEIRADGAVTQVLLESPEPLLSNPSAMAFLPNGDLLVGNYGNNSVTRVRRNASNALELVPFYTDASAPSALSSMVVTGGLVYVVTGSKRLTALDLDGTVVAEDLWPSGHPGDPTMIAADPFGEFAFNLIVAGSDGRIWRMNTGSREWARVGDFTFDTVFGLSVSPLDGALHVAERAGTIWKVQRAQAADERR